VSPPRRLHFSRPGSAARRSLWRTVFTLVGGLRVTGPAPSGPAVVVANHSSHADTAALLAALPSRARPVFAAAADYWFDIPARRVLVMSLAAALPVRRGADGAYEAMLAVAAPHLAAGGIVVVFPEGTRAQDGQVGVFRSGALRLARDTGAALVPSAVLGTADVLPKHGRLAPAPVEVRFGAAIGPDELATLDAAGLRGKVCDLLAAGPAQRRVSATWAYVARRMSSRTALAVAFAWGAAEALSWPVIAEMSLVLFAAAVPRRVLPAAVALATGSVAGVAAHVLLAAHGVDLPAPLTTAAMRAAASRQLAGGPLGIWHQALSGIPVKVYAAEAGRSGMDATQFVAAAALERFARILTVGAVIAVASRAAAPWLRRLYGPYLVVVCSSFVVLLAATVARWS
jgi:1-acyl-sn-glycerol-3-phosphate acyltransferase